MHDETHLPSRALGAGLAVAVTTPRNARAAAPLEALLEATALRDGYVAATPAEALRSEEMFFRALRGERGAALEDGFRGLGFVMERLGLGGEPLAVVREAPGAGTGKGLYVLRAPVGISPVALQAPHRDDDLDTGRILARLLAEERRFAAAAWNTLPRRSEDAAGRRVDSDLAHAPVSHLNAFTRAFGRAHPSGLVAQIHGFDAARRGESAAGGAEMIASGATTAPGPAVRASAACLRGTWRVLLYPQEMHELGGTTNANAAALRALGGTAEFLHLEIARDIRRELARDAQVRARLAACLVGAGR